ncbi:MAG: hypothetical protein HYZ50_08115 [Deltaproteobacteria bacterium]|nr:hypothetical protein [Deltaproteobacteria bacterium]
MKHAYIREIIVLAASIGLTMGTGCSTARSVVSAVPGASYVPGLQAETSSATTVGKKLHFKITPDEALQILATVAPAHGWELDAVGEQYDLQGLRGKYFRLLTSRFIGGVFEINGVFFSEATGTYIVVGKKDTGFPQDLVEPFTAAVAVKTSQTQAPDIGAASISAE